jgi:hypothetical protein
MLLGDLVATSAAVTGTSGRLEKIGRLADLLGRVPEEEIETAVAFLSGGSGRVVSASGARAISTAADIPPHGGRS